MKQIAFEIREIESNPMYELEGYASWKFIVADLGNSHGQVHLGLYAKPVLPLSHLKHSHIQLQHGIPRDLVVGGGWIDAKSHNLDFYGSSQDFGPVPNSAMEGFVPEIIQKYAAGMDLEKICIDMEVPRIIPPRSILKWKPLGFSYDSQQREYQSGLTFPKTKDLKISL